jgi:hypothetical protein
MEIQEIVALLIAERDRLSSAIEALQGGVRRRGRTRGARPRAMTPSATVVKASAKPKRRLSAAGRAAIAAAARKRWAAIKAGKSEVAVCKGETLVGRGHDTNSGQRTHAFEC